MSFFDEVETTVANTRFLQAVEDNAPPKLNLKPYADLKELDQVIRAKLTVKRLFRPGVGLYLWKKFLQAEKNCEVELDIIEAIARYRRAHKGERVVVAQAIYRDFLSDGQELKIEPKGPPPKEKEEGGKDGEKAHHHSHHSSTQRPHRHHSKQSKDHGGERDQVDRRERNKGSDAEDKESKTDGIPSTAAVTKTESTSVSSVPSGMTSSTTTTTTVATVATVNASAPAVVPDAAAAATASAAVEAQPGETPQPSAPPASAVFESQPGAGANSGDEEPGGLAQPTASSSSSSSSSVPSSASAPSSSSSSSTTESTTVPVPSGTVPAPAPATAAESAPAASTPTGTSTTAAQPPTNIHIAETSSASSSSSSSTSASQSSGMKEAKMSFAGSEEANSKRRRFFETVIRPQTEVLEQVRERICFEPPPSSLFEGLETVLAEFLKDRLPNFMQTELYKKYVQLEHYSRQAVAYKDFRIFRVLGRGAFGAVSAVQKIDTHAIFAMKEMNKKQVKQNQSEWMCINEKKVLAKMRSPFVLNLKYSFHTEESLYLIFDMCSGGDLKFHLRGDKNKCFSDERARFYSAEVLLGLEHIHSFGIVYRDLKPGNILLDTQGHVMISDLGLTIKLRKNKVLKHLAGTAGYWAPEIVMKSGTYKTSDYWSFGTFLYEMLSGRRPKCKCMKGTYEWCPFGQKRVMEENAQRPDGINFLKLEVEYPSDRFSPKAKDLLQKLFNPDPKKRLGANGSKEIKDHPYFSSMDWNRLEAKQVEPPFVPDARTVNANSIGEVGEFNKGKYRKIKLTAEDEKNYEDFTYISPDAVQEELVAALDKMDNPPPNQTPEQPEGPAGGCCSIQ